MIWIIVILLVSLAYVLQSWLWKNPKKRLPPGPRGLPILGNLHMLGSSPHRDLHRLAQKYGPIMYLRLGFMPTIVVSSPQAAELFLKTHDLVFASRPPYEAIKYLCWGQKCLSYSQYGSYWRNMRRICTLELLSNLKIHSFRNMRKEELGLLIKFIKEAAREGDAIDITARVSSFSADMSCRMILGKKYMDTEFDERGFGAVFQEGLKLTATPNFGDYIPLIGTFDLQGLMRRYKAMRKIFDNFLDKVIDEHVCSDTTHGKKKTKDFVDILLAFVGTDEDPQHPIDRSHIKAILLDMLVASMETSSTVIDWTLVELIKHPRVMRKLQNELEIVIGMEKVVEESDLEKLEYLDMVVKESLRLHAVVPLLLPHQSMEDCVVGEFFIPKNCRVIVNVWTIMRDPSAWSEVEKFWPERFEGTSIDVKGRDFQIIPFGSGRRGCPGMQLGLTMVRLVVAQLVHCFDWKLPDDVSPTELDMTEEFGTTAPRAKHLLAIPTYRLHK